MKDDLKTYVKYSRVTSNIPPFSGKHKLKTNNSQPRTESWDLIIQPQRSLLSVNLREVWRYRDLLMLMVKRDITAAYKQTVLGPVWMLLQPLFTTITFVFIFGNLAGLSTDGLPKPLFYMSGVIAWNYFSTCLTGTSSVFRSNAGIYGKVYFPRLISPLSLVVSNLVRFGVQVLMFAILFVYLWMNGSFNPVFSFNLLLAPVLVILMALISLGLGMIISAMTTKYRDMSFLMGFGMQLFMYTTPVIYPLNAAPEKYKAILAWNPMSAIIEGFRFAILGHSSFTYNTLLYSIFFAFISLFVGILIFNKVEKDFIDTV